jgi:uncharacterized protein
MKIYKRLLQNTIESLLGNPGLNKVILIFGTRRTGKTVLIQEIQNGYQGKSLILNGEDFDMQELFKNRSVSNYKRIIGDTTLLIIDEAQAFTAIGAILKLMIDSIPDLNIVATGSSSFDLLNKTGDPLTGRQIQFNLYPLAQLEIKEQETPVETLQNLDERLIFGSYPELFSLSTYQEKAVYLQQLVQSYLLKDILAFEGIRNSDKIVRLLRLIALQMGNEVSYLELSTQLGMSKNTVESYLDLLSKVFIIYKLGAYSTNARKEISKGAKWYFLDNGIRNAIINDFKLPALRNDVGALWENYLLSERIKKNTYEGNNIQYFFWRNYNLQEIDLIELKDGKLNGFEFKYSPGKKVKVPPAFSTIYPDAAFTCISKDNYLAWIA